MFSLVRTALYYFWTFTETDFSAGHTILFVNCLCFSLFCYFCHFRWQDGCYSKDKAVFRFRYRRDAVVRRFATTRHGDKISDVSAAREKERERDSCLLYPVLYIQIYNTSSVGSLAPFLPDSEHVSLCTLSNIPTRSVGGRVVELSKNLCERQVKRVTASQQG
jgi:hypothetical protein